MGRPSSLLPASGTHGVPHGCASHGLDRGNTCLAPFPAIGHALDRLQGMEVIAVDPPHRHTEHLLDLGLVGHVDGWHAPGYWQRGPSQERKLELPRKPDHLTGPFPFPRE